MKVYLLQSVSIVLFASIALSAGASPVEISRTQDVQWSQWRQPGGIVLAQAAPAQPATPPASTPSSFPPSPPGQGGQTPPGLQQSPPGLDIATQVGNPGQPISPGTPRRR